jgi:hypothetical protein
MFIVNIKNNNNNKNRLSNFVNGVSQQHFLLILSFVALGTFLILVTPFLHKNHQKLVAHNEWEKKQNMLVYTRTIDSTKI